MKIFGVKINIFLLLTDSRDRKRLINMTDNMDLTLVARQSRWNSERWFPELHDGNIELGPYYALAMAGEVGEVCNLIKKSVRNEEMVVVKDLELEMADVFTYLLLLADEYGIDLIKAFEAKQEVCELRWGKT
jgi:NTP pyrophosphatase (non-canonical NTP hydrolase)